MHTKRKKLSYVLNTNTHNTHQRRKTFKHIYNSHQKKIYTCVKYKYTLFTLKKKTCKCVKNKHTYIMHTAEGKHRNVINIIHTKERKHRNVI